MRYALPFLVLATPALAHHEAVTVALLPPLAIWAAAACGAGFGFWRAWRARKKR